MWPNPQETEEILNGKLHFLCSADFWPTITTRSSSLESALLKWGNTAFVLEVKFAAFVKSKTVNGLGALLKWLKKVFLLVLSNPEVVPLMACITSGTDPFSPLSFPLAMAKS